MKYALLTQNQNTRMQTKELINGVKTKLSPSSSQKCHSQDDGNKTTKYWQHALKICYRAILKMLFFRKNVFRKAKMVCSLKIRKENLKFKHGLLQSR